MRRTLVVLFVILLLAAAAVPTALADGPCGPNDTGHCKSTYAYDSEGGLYWDHGDGTVEGTVGSVEELNQETSTVCESVTNSKSGQWVQSHTSCNGYDDNTRRNSVIVNQSDPRYSGNEDYATMGNWEYHTLTISGEGNVVKGK